MLRPLLFLPGLLLLAIAAQAQWGVRAGLNAATLHAKTYPRDLQAHAQGRRGYQVGVFYEKTLSPRFSLVPELQVSRQRAALRVEDNLVANGSYAADYRLRRLYLHVPVLLRLGPAYFEAGPQASVLQSAHEAGTEVLGSIAGPRGGGFDRPATDRYCRYDAGLCAGLGVRLPAGFGLNLRGSQGFVSITRFGFGQQYSGRLTNQSVQAALSYQLGPRD